MYSCMSCMHAAFVLLAYTHTYVSNVRMCVIKNDRGYTHTLCCYRPICIRAHTSLSSTRSGVRFHSFAPHTHPFTHTCTQFLLSLYLSLGVFTLTITTHTHLKPYHRLAEAIGRERVGEQLILCGVARHLIEPNVAFVQVPGFSARFSFAPLGVREFAVLGVLA